MTSIEREILEKVSHLDSDRQRQVLDFVQSIEPPQKTYTARELMKLPFEEGNRLAIEALKRSATETTELF